MDDYRPRSRKPSTEWEDTLTDYNIFMLRIWKEGHENRPQRISLENTRTGTRIGFTSLDNLVEFINMQFNVARESHEN
jgi:hypothetical protein